MEVKNIIKSKRRNIKHKLQITKKIKIKTSLNSRENLIIKFNLEEKKHSIALSNAEIMLDNNVNLSNKKATSKVIIKEMKDMLRK